jgi:S1-C subfamily serine protease
LPTHATGDHHETSFTEDHRRRPGRRGSPGGGYSLGQNTLVGSANAASQASSASTPAIPNGLPDMRSIVARNAPAVVNISVTGTRKTMASQPDLPQMDPDDPLYQLFRHFRGQLPENPQPMQGLGSGFIITADGTVLTNAHVVDGAEEVIVKLSDKREFKARVLGLDKASDVAVLKIDGKNLPTVIMGNSRQTEVGEWVLAIGLTLALKAAPAPASCRPSRAICRTAATCRSSRPTLRSIRATPVARCSTCRAR